MRISDWSSDVCSSDLPLQRRQALGTEAGRHRQARQEAETVRAQTIEPVIVDVHRQDRPVEVAKRRRHPRVDREPLRANARGLLEQSPAPSRPVRSEEHTSELQSLMRISYSVFCLKKNKSKQ